METASEIYMGYVRPYLWILVFLVGLTVDVYRRPEAADRYAEALKRVYKASWIKAPAPEVMSQLWKANLSFGLQMVVWMMISSMVLVIAEATFGR